MARSRIKNSAHDGGGMEKREREREGGRDESRAVVR